MNRFRLVFIVGILSTSFISASLPAVSSEPSASHPKKEKMAKEYMTKGTVAQKIDAGNYTYVQVEVTESARIWAAAPKFSVNIGDSVMVPKGLPMNNFHSKALDQTFEVIYFVDHIKNQTNPASSPHHGKNSGSFSSTKENNISLSNIKKAEGGITVAEIFDGSIELNKKSIKVRGKVVKYNSGIMGMNWIHLQDGTSAKDGRNDLTLTTLAEASVGDTVLIEGKITLNKNFGAGYHYDVIVEDAKVSVE